MAYLCTQGGTRPPTNGSIPPLADLSGNQALSEILEGVNIEHSFQVVPGGHWWRVWRKNLYEYAQLCCFRGNS